MIKTKTTAKTVVQVTRAAGVELFRQVRATRERLRFLREQESHKIIRPGESAKECATKLAGLTTALAIVRREGQRVERREGQRAHAMANPPKLDLTLVESLLDDAAGVAEQHLVERVIVLFGDDVACEMDLSSGFSEQLGEAKYELLDQLATGLAEQKRVAAAMKQYATADTETVKKLLRETVASMRTTPPVERAAKQDKIDIMHAVLKARL